MVGLPLINAFLGIVGEKVISNHIAEVYHTLGIEAARYKFIYFLFY